MCVAWCFHCLPDRQQFVWGELKTWMAVCLFVCMFGLWVFFLGDEDDVGLLSAILFSPLLLVFLVYHLFIKTRTSPHVARVPSENG